MKRHLILGLFTASLLSTALIAQTPAAPGFPSEPIAPGNPNSLDPAPPAPEPATLAPGPRATPRIAPLPDDPFTKPPKARPAATPIKPSTVEPAPIPAGAIPRPYQPLPTARANATNPFAGGRAPSINLRIRYEVFSLPLGHAAQLMRVTASDFNLYQSLTKAVSKEEAVQETLTVVTVQSGLRAETSSIAEKIYPVEFESASRPTSFETRNTGVTVEAEGLYDPSTDTVDLNIAPEHVSLAGNAKWGPKDAVTETPEFESQRLSTSTRVSLLEPHLLGTVNRPPATKAQGNTEPPRIWFAFVTVSRVK